MGFVNVDVRMFRTAGKLKYGVAQPQKWGPQPPTMRLPNLKDEVLNPNDGVTQPQRCGP